MEEKNEIEDKTNMHERQIEQEGVEIRIVEQPHSVSNKRTVVVKHQYA